MDSECDVAAQRTAPVTFDLANKLLAPLSLVLESYGSTSRKFDAVLSLENIARLLAKISISFQDAAGSNAELYVAMSCPATYKKANERLIYVRALEGPSTIEY